MTPIERAGDLMQEAFKLIYQDAKERAPTLKNPMYGWYNATNAAKYLGVNRTTFYKWRKKYDIPFAMVDGVIRYGQKDLDKFMEKHTQRRN